ncbi:hypothetical protein [Ruminococcus sp.]|uniref:hypothetical protein n=1 Tax=Ruminococcus sp. TaxID=41978 RepID=UPI0025EE2420|nr:hypothetical protein [Ruminococcus sp.]
MRPNEYNDLLKKIKCSDNFRRRMNEMLSSSSIEMNEYEETITGTEVITVRQSRSRFAALAAAFVLVCGAVGGGVYQFARINNKTEERSNIYSDDKTFEENNNVSKTEMLLALKSGFSNYDRDNAYYYPVNSEKSIDCFIAGGSRVLFEEELFNFEWERTSEFPDDTDYYYIGFSINEAGYMQIITDGNENNYKLKNDSDLGAYKDVLTRYIIKINNEFINKLLSKKEVLGVFNNSFTDGVALYSFYNGQITENRECIVTDVDGLKDELSDLEWKVCIDGRDENDEFKDYYNYVAGVKISQNGFIYGDNYIPIMLKNESDLEKFRSILSKHIELKDYGTVASMREILDLFQEKYNGGEAKFFKDSIQDTGNITCIVNDFESLKRELSDLKWVTCRADEPLIYNDFYDAGALISRNGYIYQSNGGTSQCAYKLKNESDIVKLCEILDKYIEINNE